MSDRKYEKLLDKLLIFMSDEIERIGVDIRAVTFDFQPGETKKYFGSHPDEVIPDGEDLVAFKKYASLKETTQALHIINLARIRQYIAPYALGRQYKVRLESKGYGRAVSVRNASSYSVKKLKQVFIWLIATSLAAAITLLIEKIFF